MNGTSEEEAADFFRGPLVKEIAESEVPVVFDDDEDLAMCIDVSTKTVAAFVQKVTPPDAVLGIEEPFVLELPSSEEQPQAPTIGTIDALVMNNEVTEKWKLKTSNRKWSPDKTDFDYQPTADRIAARIRLGVLYAQLRLLIATKTRAPDVQVEALMRNDDDEERSTRLVASIHRTL